MDGLVFIIIALVFVFLDMKNGTIDSTEKEQLVLEDETRVAKVNELYYDDPNAFSLIINALGFPKGVE